MRFIHTADWQLGAGFTGRTRPDDLRSARLESVARLLEVAAKERVDFTVVAGDIFESNRVSRRLLYDVKEVLRKAACPVYILPGNHDPLSEDSLYSVRDEWRELPGNVQILKERAPVQVGEATLYPCPCVGKVSSKDPTGWIPPRSGRDGIRIGVAHGSWLVLPDVSLDDHPVEPRAAGTRSLDYLALGHWHSTFPDTTQVAGRTFYSGTHEPTAFGERDSGNVLLVSIGAPGALPDVEKRRIGRFSWLQVEKEISDPGSLAALRREFESIPGPESTLVRAAIKGAVRIEVRSELARLADEMTYRFFSFECDTSGVSVAVTGSDVSALPSPLLRQVSERLRSCAQGESTALPPDWSFGPKYAKGSTGAAATVLSGVAERALELLFSRVPRQGGARQ